MNPGQQPSPDPRKQDIGADPLSGASLGSPGAHRPGAVLEIGDEDFAAEVLKSTVPVLVDFYTPTCGPCKRLSPILDEIARDFAADIKVVKVNVADNFQTAIDQGVHVVPTIKLFKAGQVEFQKTGVMSKAQLESEIRKAI